jgi:hypothetical protein
LTASHRFTTIPAVSYYPPPYSQPPYTPAGPAVDYSQFAPPGQDDLLAPARRAGILMAVLGMLVAFMGACNGGSALMLTPERMAENQAAMRELGWPESPIKPETTRIASAITGGLTLLVGIAFVVNGVFVRRGTPAAVTTGLFLTGGLLLLVGGLCLMAIIALLVSPMVAAGMLCIFLVPLLLLVWLMIWLIAASKNSSRIAHAAQQYQAQYFQYQQHQQAYGGYAAGAPYPPAGYGPVGYGQPPAAPMPQGLQPPSAPQPAPPSPLQQPPASEQPSRPGGPDEPPATT